MFLIASLFKAGVFLGFLFVHSVCAAATFVPNQKTITLITLITVIVLLSLLTYISSVNATNAKPSLHTIWLEDQVFHSEDQSRMSQMSSFHTYEWYVKKCLHHINQLYLIFTGQRGFTMHRLRVSPLCHEYDAICTVNYHHSTLCIRSDR